MSKFSKRSKRYRKNRTLKAGGREGTLDVIGDKLGNIIQSVSSTAIDTGLKIAGLERIHKNNEPINEPINQPNEPNIINKTGSAIINNVNEVLDSDIAKETTQQAAQDTADIIKESAATFNQALNDPAVKTEVEEAIKNAGEIGAVAIDAAREPFNEAVDVAAEAAQKMSSAAVSGAIKVGTDAVAAVPFWGAIIDAGKMVNDGSKAASAMVEAGSEAVEAASDAFIETKENMQQGLRELEEKKKMAEQITNRTTQSINHFENSITGGKKSRRRLLKRKGKSKRVRFNL
jgi:hypothetical protein